MRTLKPTMAAIVVVLFATITDVPGQSSFDDRKNDGQYFCEVERASGFAGRVRLPDSEMKFFLRVGPVTYSDVAHEVCRHDIDYWFRDIFEKNQPYPDHAPASKNADDRAWIGNNCFASNELVQKSLDGKKSSSFRGYDGWRYYGPST